MIFNKFEDLDCWKIARQLTNESYKVTRNKPCCMDYGFVDQMRRAALSVMNNIAEGFERGSNKDFVKFLFIARASAGEVRSMTYIGLDQGYFDQNKFEELQELTIRSGQMCWGLIKHLRKNIERKK